MSVAPWLAWAAERFGTRACFWNCSQLPQELTTDERSSPPRPRRGALACWSFALHVAALRAGRSTFHGDTTRT